ncbi:MAG: hypothetical protein JO340_06455 [Acidobacteriaceae bacterium]|nr:hypothetical protein [Acidobacteriaceae bacterium]
MRLAFAFVFAWSLCAQTPAASSGPTLGFIPGAAPWLVQPILGIPGAARLGAPIALPNTVSQLYLAPGQSYAVALQGADDPASFVPLRVNGILQIAPSLVPLTGALAHPDLVVFSPTGRSLVLYSQRMSQARVFTGLPNSPRLAAQLSNIVNAVKLAVSDDAQLLLLSDTMGNVDSLSQAGASAPVYHSSQVAALAFLPRSHDAIVCDPAAATAVLLQAGTSLQVLPPPAAECQPQAVTATADGNTILLACPTQHMIWSVNRASGVPQVYRTAISPTAFDSLAARDTFLLSPADSTGTWWMISWQDGAPVISFVGARP